MSGPKVVRVRTREELLAETQAIVARLEHAIARWNRTAADTDDAAPASAGTAARRDEILALLGQDRFAECNQAAVREIAYLADDTERLIERAATRHAHKLAARLRARQNAKVLLDAIVQRGVVTDTGLLAQLEVVARGGQQEGSEQVLAAGFRLLAPAEQATRAATSAQLELASRLSDGSSFPDLAQWRRSKEAEVADVRVTSLAHQLELLRRYARDAQTVYAFEDQLTEVMGEASPERRSMLLDSLQVRIGAATKHAKACAALALEAGELATSLTALGGADAVEALRELEAAVVSGDAPRLTAQLETCRRILDAQVRSEASRSRRNAVLQGLASLGYTVHEGMETAWMEQGRLVMHKPGSENYGVELASAADADRMQVRTVALKSERGPLQDIQAEQSWCQDFTLLRQGLVEQGTEVVVDKALGIGAVPVKVVIGEQGTGTSTNAATRTNRSVGR